MPIEQIARHILAFSWIYHGVFPKLLHIAPIEKQMTASLGFSAEVSDLITRVAGVGEIIFGIIIWFLYQNRLIIWLNIVALGGLLGFVVLLTPHFLIEAFNPVTTNIPLIALSFILLQHHSTHQQNKTP